MKERRNSERERERERAIIGGARKVIGEREKRIRRKKGVHRMIEKDREESRASE